MVTSYGVYLDFEITGKLFIDDRQVRPTFPRLLSNLIQLKYILAEPIVQNYLQPFVTCCPYNKHSFPY